MLVVSGNSGQGKSWLLFALAQQLTAGDELIILLEAMGRAHDDMEEAARIFWHEIKNNDMPLDLSRIAERLRRVDSNRARRWLILLVDGVQNEQEARELARQPWEKWGVRLLVSCEPEIADAFEHASHGRCATPERVGDFTSEELHGYLRQCFGADWPDIPGDVRNTLRRPLLARLYRDIAQFGAWHPTNEYELCQRYWLRITEHQGADALLDRTRLERLARSILDAAPYPWTPGQLLDAGLDSHMINNLIRVGWLRRAPRDHFEVWHNRLLNWAVAAALVNSFQSGDVDARDLCAALRELYLETPRDGRPLLGYVAMDVFWLLANSGKLNDLLDPALRTLEDMPWGARHPVYSRLLPTLGSAIVPALFKRLNAVAPSEDPTLAGQLVDAIIAIEDADVPQHALTLLQSDNPRAQRTAMRILTRRPCAERWTDCGRSIALDTPTRLDTSPAANSTPCFFTRTRSAPCVVCTSPAELAGEDHQRA